MAYSSSCRWSMLVDIHSLALHYCVGTSNLIWIWKIQRRYFRLKLPIIWNQTFAVAPSNVSSCVCVWLALSSSSSYSVLPLLIWVLRCQLHTVVIPGEKIHPKQTNKQTNIGTGTPIIRHCTRKWQRPRCRCRRKGKERPRTSTNICDQPTMEYFATWEKKLWDFC